MKTPTINPIEKRIEELTTRFERLYRKQADIIKELRGLSHTGESEWVNPEVTDQNRQKYSKRLRPRIGDRVKITNPNQGQLSFGVIQDFCKDGKPRINTGQNRPLVIRINKNVICLEQGNGNEYHGEPKE